jgi:HAD superfamily hydrolase (TIGR01509 family)
VRVTDIELVIFDCDGVLVDTEPIAVRANVLVGAELGWPMTADDVVELFVGRSNVSIGEQVAKRLGEQAVLPWQRRFEELHREAVDREVDVVPGIREALAGLQLPSCVASSGSHEKMRHTLGRTGLYDWFDGRIFSASEVRHGKPAPDLFLHAADRMGVRPEACVVVEDSKYGVRAARAAGMRVLGYAGGVTPADWLAAEGAQVFTDMRELPELLERLGGSAQTGTAGTVGYAAEADRLLEQYESVSFEQVHQRVLPLLPTAPANVLDLGAGTGRDAAALAGRGYRVTAVEPVAELREPARLRHAAAGVTGVAWVDASLPLLAGVTGSYELVMGTAVWMHLHPREREAAFQRVLELLAPGGLLLLTVRHGPVPAGRRMFEVPDAELLAQAAAAGLRTVHQEENGDPHARAGVRWSVLGFAKD